MKTALRLFVMAVLLLLPAGCDWFGGEPDYLPLGIGSTWQYQMLTIRATADSTDTLYGDTVTLEIKGTAVLPDSQSALLIENRYSGYAETTYWRETAQWFLTFEDFDDDEPDTVLALPLEENKTWCIDDVIWGTLVGKEEVATTAGRYKDAWKVMVVDDIDDTTYFWLGPDVGRCMEKEEYTASGVTWTDITDLLSVTIK